MLSPRADTRLRCANCGRTLGEFGARWLVAVQVHPEGRGAGPLDAGGFSITCRVCKVHLDVRLYPLTSVADPHGGASPNNSTGPTLRGPVPGESPHG